MNCTSTAYLLGKAIKNVKEKMDLNPTIPTEATGQLIIEQYHEFLDIEDRNDDSAKYETGADDYWEAQLKEEV